MNAPLSAASFVETVEHLRFTEFCDACRDFHYIGLRHGPPGAGKTLSARRHAKADSVAALPPPEKLPPQELERWRGRHTVFHTAPVVNSPGGLEGHCGAPQPAAPCFRSRCAGRRRLPAKPL